MTNMSDGARAAWTRGLAAVVIASAIATGIASERQTFAFLWQTRHMPYAERRAILLGPLDAAAARLRSQLPESADVALITAAPADRDAAVFLNAMLYPRRSRIFESWQAYRANTDAALYRDAHAMNAAVLLPRPRNVVVVDSASTGVARVVRP
jgi:hypothetical protein